MYVCRCLCLRGLTKTVWSNIEQRFNCAVGWLQTLILSIPVQWKQQELALNTMRAV